ncbi:MAG: proton-conducting transporter membrane subunit [Acetobacteraceae bacterium]
MVLILLAILIAALAALGCAPPAVPRRIVHAGIAASRIALAALAVACLAGAGGTAVLALPVGPPGAALHLAGDPLAACFLLLLAATAPLAARPLALAAAAAAVLAGDGFSLAAGVLLLGGGVPDRSRIFAAACVIAALALAGPPGDFAAIRAAPPEGVRAAGVLVLTLAAATALIRSDGVVAVYLLARVLLDLCGPAQPAWWGAPLALLGAAVALAGAWRACLAGTLHAVAAAAPLHLAGMAVIGLGLALFARAVDQPAVAAQALDAAWLAVVGHALCRALLLLCADAAEAGAGTRRLDRLGGLIHRMPATAACWLAGLFTVAALPPGLGFAAFWQVFQSLLAAARTGGFLTQMLVAGVALALALAVGLSGLAAVRLFGVGFLGRPRTPRTAAADEAPRRYRIAAGGLAGVAALLGLAPALALAPSAGWTASAAHPWLALRAGADVTGYLPIALAGLLAAIAVVVLRALRPASEQRGEATWNGGFAPPPPWLPFGDPATQFGPASFVAPLSRLRAHLPRRRTVRRRLVAWRARLRRLAAAVALP